MPADYRIAYTFGTGRYRLLDEHCVSQFGLRVALNAACYIDPQTNAVLEGKFRGADTRRLDLRSLHNRRQSTVAGAFDDFSVPTDVEALKSVSALIEDRLSQIAQMDLGARLDGRDALRLSPNRKRSTNTPLWLA
jgi:uncharacterized protein (TIGR04141 family)